jgi:hypothetical protein
MTALRLAGVGLVRSALAASLLLASAGAGVAGEIYQWVDEGGALHFTDDPARVPGGAGPDVKRIPVHEGRDVAPDDPARPAARDRRIPNEAAVDRMLRQMWRDYRACLRRGDTERALSYIVPEERPKYRKIFELLKGKLRAIVDEEVGFRKDSIEEYHADYTLETRSGGESTNYGIRFVVDLGGEWKLADG